MPPLKKKKKSQQVNRQTLKTTYNLVIISADADKNTPLFFAAEGGHLPCVALLMVKCKNSYIIKNFLKSLN